MGAESTNLSKYHTSSEHPDISQIPVKIKLPEISVPAKSLTQLMEGDALEFVPVNEGIQVELEIEGCTVGVGEIINVGDKYAVLIDEMSALDMRGNAGAPH